MPVSASIATSRLLCQCTQEWSSTKIAWPRIVRGPSRPIFSAHCSGVVPCRFTISRNSLTLCAAWVVIGRLRSAAAATLSRSRSSVQVSICAGNTMPKSRPEGCCPAASITRSAASKPRRPPASSQAYFSSCRFSTVHLADA